MKRVMGAVAVLLVQSASPECRRGSTRSRPAAGQRRLTRLRNIDVAAAAVVAVKTR